MMWMKKAIVVLVATIMLICMVPASDSIATSEINEEFIDAGYAESSESFFYYAKFGLNGFPFTDGSVSADTPTAGVGKSILDNTIYASVSGLDVTKSYFLLIEETVDGALQCLIAIDLGSNAVSRVAWISLDDASKAYVNGAEAEYLVKSGSLAPVTNDTKLTFYLKENIGVPLVSAALDDSYVAKFVDKDPLNHSVFIDCYITENSGETNQIEDLGMNHGWSGTKSQYAGAKISTDIGNYVCVFFMTNVGSPVIKIMQGGKVFTIPSESTFYNSNAENSGYGYAYININDMVGFDATDDGFVAMLFNGDKLCATFEDPIEYGDNVGLYICIGSIIIIALVVLAYWALYIRGGLR